MSRTDRPDHARELRRELTNVRGLLDTLGVEFNKQRTDDAWICCPAHADKSPSCSVTLGDDGTMRFRCFSCGWTGDVLTYLATLRGLDLRVDFYAVLREAAELAGAWGTVDELDRQEVARAEREGRTFTAPKRTAAPVAAAPRRVEPEAPAVSDETYHGIATLLLEWCSPMRTVSPDVAGYLDARGIFADAEAVDVRGLPRDGRDLCASLLSAFERADLEAAGVLRRGHDALDWPAWSLLIPWRDRFGRIACIQRRHLGDVKPKYRFPSGRSPVAPFGADILADALGYLGPDASIVVVEGALDCLARRRIARARGESVAVLGVASATTPTVGLPLDLLAGRRVVLALDRDEAGARGRDALGAALAGVAAELRVAA